MKLERTREEKFGCLSGLIGIRAGPEILFRLNPPPPDLQCGLAIVAMQGLGMIFGALAGTVVGMIVSKLMPNKKDKKNEP